VSNTSYQSGLLAPALDLLRLSASDADGHPEAGMDVLEAASSRLGGFDLDGYRELSGKGRMDVGLALAWADKLLAAVSATAVPPRLALAALAQPQIDMHRTRTTGAYYTDFRLARYLAERVRALPGPTLCGDSSLVDPASGTGILLAALIEAVSDSDKGAATELVGAGACACDLGPRVGNR